MSREAFEKQHEPTWRRLEGIVDDLEHRRRSSALGELPALYRRAAYHLALARSRLYGVDLERDLNRLVLRAHHALYRRRGLTWSHVANQLMVEMPRRVRREARLFGLACLLLFGPLGLAMATVLDDPERAYAIVDPETAAEYRSMYDPDNPDSVMRDATTDFLMFGFYIYNNVGIAFRTFASGLIFGIGAIFILVFNGIAIGTVAGDLAAHGLGETFFPFVIGHGAFELPGIALAGMAGLKLGFALLAPGRRSRGQALAHAARDAMPIVWGVAAFLLVAAFLEAFWSSSTLVPAQIKYFVGGILWIVVALFLTFAGRGAGSRDAA